MAKSIKFKTTENVTPEKIHKAIELLDAGGSKKAACDTLGIRYNTTRLQKIIDDFIEREERVKRFKDQKKGTPVSKQEALDIIKSYLECASVDKVAKEYYRSPYIVDKVLEHYGAKLHNSKTDYFNPILLPDTCIATKPYSPGDFVWAARYNMLAVIKREYTPGVYAIRILGRYERDAYQPIEELGSLRHLEELGIDFTKLRIEEPDIKDSDNG